MKVRICTHDGTSPHLQQMFLCTGFPLGVLGATGSQLQPIGMVVAIVCTFGYTERDTTIILSAQNQKIQTQPTIIN